MSSGLRLCSGLLASSEALTVGLRQYMVWMEANNTQFKGDNGAAGDYIGDAHQNLERFAVCP